VNPAWQPTRELREATQQAMQTFHRQHPKRRAPDFDHDAFERDMCQAFAILPVAAVPLVAAIALDDAHGNYPSPWEVKQAARAFLKRNMQAAEPAPFTPQEHPMDAIAVAQMAQARAMLEAMGHTPDVDRLHAMHVVASVTEAVWHRLRARVKDGSLPVSRLDDFRNGTWPDLDTLKRIVRDIAKAGDITVSAKVREMLTLERAA
jgi:hypothetical protein